MAAQPSHAARGTQVPQPMMRTANCSLTTRFSTRQVERRGLDSGTRCTSQRIPGEPFMLKVPTFAVVSTFALLLAGCDSMMRTPAPAATSEVRKLDHPEVRIEGIDGTVFVGELLNGTVTIDSGQGQLTLQTDHIHAIGIASGSDMIDSDSVKVVGKIRETQFEVRTEHGVFPLLKERLKKIDFLGVPAATDPTLSQPRAASTTGQMNAGPN